MGTSPQHYLKVASTDNNWRGIGFLKMASCAGFSEWIGLQPSEFHQQKTLFRHSSYTDMRKCEKTVILAKSNQCPPISKRSMAVDIGVCSNEQDSTQDTKEEEETSLTIPS